MILKNNLITEENYSDIAPKERDRKITAAIDIDSFCDLIINIFYDNFEDFDIKDFEVDSYSIYVKGTEHLTTAPDIKEEDDLDKAIKEVLSKVNINDFVKLRYMSEEWY